MLNINKIKELSLYQSYIKNKTINKIISKKQINKIKKKIENLNNNNITIKKNIFTLKNLEKKIFLKKNNKFRIYNKYNINIKNIVQIRNKIISAYQDIMNIQI